MKHTYLFFGFVSAIALSGAVILDCSAAQQASEKAALAKDGPIVLSVACTAEKIFLHDETLGDICATAEEYTSAVKEKSSTQAATLIPCIMSHRAANVVAAAASVVKALDAGSDAK